MWSWSNGHLSPQLLPRHPLEVRASTISSSRFPFLDPFYEPCRRHTHTQMDPNRPTEPPATGKAAASSGSGSGQLQPVVDFLSSSDAGAAAVIMILLVLQLVHRAMSPCVCP